MVDGIVADLPRALVLLPLIVEQARREESYVHGEGLPTATVVCRTPDCDGRPHWYDEEHPVRWLEAHPPRIDSPNEMDCADPTGEAVVAAARDGLGTERATVDRFITALVALHGASSALFDVMPASSASVRHDPPLSPTNGETDLDRQRTKTGAVEAESACVACDLGVSVVGPLTAMLCAADLQAWIDAGTPARGAQGEDRITKATYWTGWIGRRRAELAATAAVEPAEVAYVARWNRENIETAA
ncbi:MAG: hypothetical protein ACR2MN_14585 [Acidimicrobiales bacterium]